MKTITAAILSIIVLFAMTGANAAEPEKPCTDTTVITELSQIPDGYDASQDAILYVLAIPAE